MRELQRVAGARKRNGGKKATLFRYELERFRSAWRLNWVFGAVTAELFDW
jgi:hypothetical protein